MLGFAGTGILNVPIPSISRTLPIRLINNSSKHTCTFINTHTPNPRNRTRLVGFAENGNGLNGSDAGEDMKKDDGLPRFNLSWKDLLLNPDPDNLLAVGLTGLLTWASVQVLWQLFCISLAILLAALKYSFIAALLIFILITLL